MDALALLWPVSCAGCGAPDRQLCSVCERELLAVDRAAGSLCDGLSLGAPCYVAGPYAGVVRAVLLAYKHGGAYGFARPLARRLSAPLTAACMGATRDPPIIVPLPSRAKRERERGYRHVEVLVRVALRASGMRVPVVRALRALPGRTGQVGLGAAARERNAARIALRRGGRGLRGAEVVLVDDIVTTGATVRAAVAVLELAGARVIAVAALCAAERADTRGNREVEAAARNE